MKKVITIILNKSISTPVFTISITLNRLLLNTIAFGGVPTGSINPKDAASVAGIIKSNGSIFSSIESDARIGSTI
jgi:hypothetical protein